MILIDREVFETEAADAKGATDNAICDAFWRIEIAVGYEQALKIIAYRFGVTCAHVERLLIEQDELDNGNV